MNKLLDRQVRKFFGDSSKVPPQLLAFFESVSSTYDGFEEDRALTVRSLELSSQELIEANQKIREESERQKTILEALRTSTAVLRPEGGKSKEWLTSKDEAVYLANSLSRLIQEQKEHEKQLEVSKQRTEEEKAKAEAILQSIGDGVFAVGLDLKVMLMNPVAQKLSGFSFQEAYGKPYQGIFRFEKEKNPEDPYPDFVGEVVRTGATKELANHTLLVKKDGTKLPISDSAAPIKDSRGNIFGCIVVVRDASRERALEQAKDEFISIAAHQLRTPLGSMSWTMEMLLSKPDLAPDSREKISKIYNSNKRLTYLVNDLLNVSRIDQGKMLNDPKLIDVVSIIRTIMQELDEEAHRHRVSLELKINSPDIPQVSLDPMRFSEVIQNLLSNAIKYNIENGRVVIMLHNLGDHLNISVADTGIGIPKEGQGRVFSKFYRAENATKSDTTGSGLGLFVVKAYVEGWGGQIRFVSEEGKGTTFSIDIPYKAS